jgi:succinyl-CoA synthetase alpha subunit
MSILINENTNILIQGITGWQASMDTKYSLNYGSKIIAGVTPGKSGQVVHGVPVYNTIKSAQREHPEINASAIYVPARAAKEAVLEAIDAGIKLILMIPEFVPRHDMAEILAIAKKEKVIIVGPNTNGLISPGKSKLGGIGGDRPERMYVPGSIGVISRSGGMSAEISLTIKRAGMGVSTCISMGGEAIVGTSMKEYLELFAKDPETEAVVLFGEPGTTYEEEVAAYLKEENFKKPVIALIVGLFQENFPKGVSFGHAAAMIDGNVGSPMGKIKALREAGVLVANGLEEIPLLLKQVLNLK